MVLIGLFALFFLWSGPALSGPLLAVIAPVFAATLAGQIVGAVLGIVASLALSFVSQALLKPAAAAPSAQSSGGSAPTVDNKITVRQPAAARQIVYGKTRIGGVYGFIHCVEDNARLLLAICVAGHPVEAIDEVWFNDVLLVLDEDGEVTEGIYAGKALVRKHLGGHDQVADGNFIAAAPDKWTADHRLRGIAYLAVELLYDGQVYTSGVPNISVVMRGKNDIYDPRTGLVGYSNNPALCLANYLCDTTYGVPVDYLAGIDGTALIAAANACDEDVALKAGGTENRYEVAGGLLSSQEPQEIIGRLLGCMHGKAPYDGERWRIQAGVYQTPTITFTDDDLRAGPKIQTLTSLRDSFNAVKGTFVGPDDNWQKADFEPIASATYKAQDGGVETFKDIELPLTSSASMAQRIAKIDLLAARQEIAASMPCKLTAWRCQAGDTIGWTSERYGWTAKPFEVTSLRFAVEETAGGPVLAIDLELRETAAAIYDWETDEESEVDPAPNTDFPSVFDVLPATNIVASEELYVTRDGAGVKTRAHVSWVASVDAFVEGYRVEFRPAGGDWRKRPVTAGLNDTIDDIAPGHWEFRVYAVNAIGVDSDQIAASIEITGLLGPPSPPTGVSLVFGPGFALMRWTQSPDVDVRIGGALVVKHSSLGETYILGEGSDTLGQGSDQFGLSAGLGAASWDTATLVHEAVPGSATSVMVPLLTGTYLLKFRDSSGVYCIDTAYIAGAQDSSEYVTLGSVVEHPSFSGAKTNCSVVGGKLVLTAGQALGLYEFASSPVDLASTRFVRVTANVASTVVRNDSAWDSSDPSDSPEPWDANTTGNEAAGHVEFCSAITAGSFTAWSRLDSTEVAARYLSFRYFMGTSDLLYGIETSALSVEIQEKVV